MFLRLPDNSEVICQDDAQASAAGSSLRTDQATDKGESSQEDGKCLWQWSRWPQLDLRLLPLEGWVHDLFNNLTDMRPVRAIVRSIVTDLLGQSV
jgi:hypothetical protein